MFRSRKIVQSLLIVICFLFSLAGSGQKARLTHLTTFDEKFIHFGFSLGINMFDFNLRHYLPIGVNPGFIQGQWDLDPIPITAEDSVRADVSRLIPGFTVAIITNMRLGRDFDLRFLPGMSFGERILKYNIPVIDNNIDFSQFQYDYSIKSTFIDLPVLFKYKATRINNGRPYVVFGGAMRIDISKSASEDLVGLTRTGLYAELGAGWDSYLPFFRFSVEAKISLGLNNQLGNIPDPDQRPYYTQAIKSLKSNIFTLCFHFE